MTDYGTKLLSNISQEHKVKIFYHLASDLNLNNRPLWTQEKSNPHDLFGFFAANDQSSVIALNLYQHPEVAVTTYLHELFHLYDPYIHDLSKKVNPTHTEKFIGEFRAYLAELNYYIQKQEANSKQFLKPVENYKFHSQFIRRGKIKYEKLYKHLLETHYPTKNNIGWKVDTAKPVEIKVQSQNSSIKSSKEVNIENNNINNTMYEILKTYLEEDKSKAFKILAKVRYRKFESSIETDKNKKIQKEIKSVIGKNIKSYLKKNNLLDISTLATQPVQGTSFGPKERVKGD